MDRLTNRVLLDQRPQRPGNPERLEFSHPGNVLGEARVGRCANNVLVLCSRKAPPLFLRDEGFLGAVLLEVSSVPHRSTGGTLDSNDVLRGGRTRGEREDGDGEENGDFVLADMVREEVDGDIGGRVRGNTNGLLRNAEAV